MRKAFVTGLVLLVVLAGIVIAADRVGLRAAQDEIAKNVASQYRLDHAPEVSIKGFPFITQALGGEYGEIDINVGEIDQQGVRLTEAMVTLRNVKAPISDAMNGDSSRMVAGTATSTATVAYADVGREVPRGMQISPNGSALQVRGPVTVSGLAKTVTATVTVRPVGRGVRVVPRTVRTDGVGVPVSLVRQAFTFTIPVRGLPFGARISRVEVEPDGLRVSATANDVKLSSLTAP